MRDRPLSAFVAEALRESERRRASTADERSAARTVAHPLPGRVSVDELAMAASAGDVQAIGRLYDAMVGPIYRYVAVRVHRREDAEDLTQLVFERIPCGVAQLPGSAGELEQLLIAF